MEKLVICGLNISKYNLQVVENHRKSGNKKKWQRSHPLLGVEYFCKSKISPTFFKKDIM
jgi:hypothetical protein